MELGDINFEVHTTSGRGHTPEEVAEFALDKIMYVSKDANPLIREQAETFKDYIRQVLVKYLKQAVQSDRTTLANRLREAGHSDLITLTVSAVPASTGTTAFLDFTNTTWSTATVTARGALIYNSTYSDTSVAVLDFGADKTSTAGDFTIIFPAADATNAIIRIA
jgi:hypothetical protein